MLTLRAPSRWWTSFALALCVLCMSSCTSLTTRFAGWYVTREIDRYLDLTSEQQHVLRAHVDAQLSRLRRDELPKWLTLLRELRDQMDRGTSEVAIARLQRRTDALLDHTAHLLIPEVSQLLSKLDADQIAHFEREMLEEHEEKHEEEEALDEQLVEAIESLVDDLQVTQQETIRRAARALPDRRPQRYRVDKQRILSTAALLRTHPGPQAIQQELTRLWTTRYDVLGPDCDRDSIRTEQRRFFLLVDGTLSREQRDYAVEQLSDRIRSVKRFLLPVDG